MFNDLLLQMTGLAGFAALVALVINVLKTFGVVKDDTAELWSAGGNLLGLVALYLLRLFNPEFDVPGAAAQVTTFVNAVTPVGRLYSDALEFKTVTLRCTWCASSWQIIQ